MYLKSDIRDQATGVGRQGGGSRQSGFALVTAIFILVVLAGLGAAMVSISTSQHTTVAMDVQSVRAYQAARAGIEWGAYQVLKVANTCPTSPATLTFAGTPLAGFTTITLCESSTHDEAGVASTRYTFTATATYASPGTPDYVAREVRATIVR